MPTSAGEASNPSVTQRVDGNHDGAEDVYDPDDAISSAANYLHVLLARVDGNLGRRSSPTTTPPPYVSHVLARAPGNSRRQDAGVSGRRRRRPATGECPGRRAPGVGASS